MLTITDFINILHCYYKSPLVSMIFSNNSHWFCGQCWGLTCNVGMSFNHKLSIIVIHYITGKNCNQTAVTFGSIHDYNFYYIWSTFTKKAELCVLGFHFSCFARFSLGSSAKFGLETTTLINKTRFSGGMKKSRCC